MTTSYTIHGEIHEIALDAELADLTRSSDPYTRRLLEGHVAQVTKKAGKPFHASLTRQELTHLAHRYGEQYADKPCDDLDQYFDIINNRWRPRALRTHDVQHYLFGSGKSYRANISALCCCGEALAGYAMDTLFNYTPIVRPLGIMPDLLCDNGVMYSLTEAKSSTASPASVLRDKYLHQFLVDVKTRASGFRYAYEAFLVCTQFLDGGVVQCSVLRVDITGASAQRVRRSGHRPPPKPPDDHPRENLDRFLKLAAMATEDDDRYLAELLHDEAVRAAVLATLTVDVAEELSDGDEDRAAPRSRTEGIGAQEFERNLESRVHELQLNEAWNTLQSRWPGLRNRRREILANTTRRLRNRQIPWGDLEN